jgi:hypothetical protein
MKEMDWLYLDVAASFFGDNLSLFAGAFGTRGYQKLPKYSNI